MSDIQNIFERREHINHAPLLLLEFEKLQGYGVNGKIVGMDMVLRSVASSEVYQLDVAIPQSLIDQYKLMIQATMLNIKLDIDVMEDYQSVVGIYLRRVIFRQNEEGTREAWVYTLSDMGEAAYYRVPEYLAAIFAITRHLPILAEAQAMRCKSLANALQAVQKYLDTDSADQLKYSEILILMIEQEEDNQAFLSELSDEELSHALTRTELEALRERVIVLEKYEWAQRFTDIINRQQDEEK